VIVVVSARMLTDSDSNGIQTQIVGSNHYATATGQQTQIRLYLFSTNVDLMHDDAVLTIRVSVAAVVAVAGLRVRIRHQIDRTVAAGVAAAVVAGAVRVHRVIGRHRQDAGNHVVAVQLQLGRHSGGDAIMLLVIGVQDDDAQIRSTREQNCQPVHSKTQD